MKLPLIEEAAANFLDHAPDDKRARFQKFCKNNISWLPDYAMFNVLRRVTTTRVGTSGHRNMRSASTMP